MATEAETGAAHLQTKEHQTAQPTPRVDEARKDAPYRFQKETILPTPLFWIPSLQNCERVNFYCLKSPSFWGVATTALAN